MIVTQITSISTHLMAGILLYAFLASACSGNDTQQKMPPPPEPSVVTSDIKSQHKHDTAQSATLTEENTTESKLITLARSVTIDYQLTPLPLECLKFELLDKLVEGKHVIDVRERHSKSCGSDQKTSPRIYSIAIDEVTGRVWSDARSLLGQLEILEATKKTPD